MELSPRLYRIFVRPNWFSHYLFRCTIGSSEFYLNNNVLDFGCGIGSYCIIFHASKYIGIDCCSKRIKYAKKLYPGYNFITSNNCNIPLRNSSVDYIFVISVFHHISTGELLEYNREFHRVLKTNGRIILIEPCVYKNSPICNSFMRLIDKGDFIRSTKGYLKLFDDDLFHKKVVKRYRQLLLYNKIYIIAKPINK